MGNRAVITTEKDMAREDLGIYLHWNGGAGSVGAFLEYCDLRGFAAPDKSDYGYSRLCQVIGNFMGADGNSLGIGKLEELDCDNWDNGMYILNGWKVVARKFFKGEEQNCYDRWEFLKELDASQPDSQQLGTEMMEALRFHGKRITDVSWNYHYEISKRKENGISARPFEIGKFYTDCKNRPFNIVRIVDKPYMEAVIEKDCEEFTVPRFTWKDGSESIILSGNDRRTIVSMEEVSS